MPRIKDQAVCIRRSDWSETSQLVTLLTQEHGLVRGLAKGSKRTSPGAVARFSGGFELLTGGQIVGVVKTTTDLATLIEWDLQNPYYHLRQNLSAQRLALYAADLCRAFLAELDPHPVVFEGLGALLEGLADVAGRGAVLLAFQWRLLTDCGYQPRLDSDVITGEVVGLESGSEVFFFDPLAAGVTRLAGRSSQSRWRVRATTIALLRKLAAEPGLPQGSWYDPEAVWRANRLMCHYAAVLLDRQLPTMVWVIRDRPGSAGDDTTRP